MFCPDPPLTPPEHKDDARLTRLYNEIQDMQSQISAIELERDDVVPYLREQRHIVFDHIKAIEDRYNDEIARIRYVIGEYEDAIREIQEGNHG